MWYLIVSIPDLCTLTYFDIINHISVHIIAFDFIACVSIHIRKYDFIVNISIDSRRLDFLVYISQHIRILDFYLVGHWLDMVYLPTKGNFVDHIFLKAQCLARILQHVSPLTMAA